MIISSSSSSSSSPPPESIKSNVFLQMSQRATCENLCEICVCVSRRAWRALQPDQEGTE